MKADPASQALLLDLQEVDTRLSQLDHAEKSLPERVEWERLTAARTQAEEDQARAQVAVEDVEREVTKADQDVQLVRDRAERNRSRLEAGTGSAKDLQGLQHELESLARRQSALEDVELEVMERAEEARGALERTDTELATLTEQAQAAEAALGTRTEEMAAERVRVQARRGELAPEVPGDLRALYDRIRAQSGVGAAALTARRCGGCRLELNPAELGRIRGAADDDVVRCEECGRILVRTAESGL